MDYRGMDRCSAPSTARRPYLVIAVKLLLLAGLIAASNQGVLDRLDYLIQMKRYLAVGVHAGVWGIAISSLVVVTLTPSRPGRIVWAVFLALATVVADVYYVLTQLRFTIDSAELFWDMRFWMRDAIEAFWLPMLWPFAKAVGIFLILIVPPRLPQLRHRRLLLLPGLPILSCVGVFYRTGGYGGEGLPIQFSTLGLAGLLAVSPLSSGEREPVRLTMTRAPAIRNIVLVVDESIRGDFIDLVNPDGTTPYLASLRAQIVSYGMASAGSNCSQASNAILRMGANPSVLGLGGDNLMRNPTVWKYARAAGYDTTFLDAQAKNGVLINYMTPQEKMLLDRFIQIDMPLVYQNDHEAARRLREVLGEPGRHFVYVNKHGAHFPYERSYPSETGRFRPTLKIGAPISDRGALLNSYRNAVEWSVDGFFRTLLDGLDLRDGLIVYTSDHGQNLLEDGDPVTHCRRVASLREAMVPLLVLTGDAAIRARFAEGARRNLNRASHFQIFPTMLALFGFEPEGIRRTYYLTLLDVVKEQVGFTSGTVFGRFGIPPTWHPVPANMAQCCRGEGQGP